MSEILIFWLSALISQSQMAPYLTFILLQKSTLSVNMVLSSQNARLCRNCVLIRSTKLREGTDKKSKIFISSDISTKSQGR